VIAVVACLLQITNVALDLVKEELRQGSDSFSMDTIDNILNDMHTVDEQRSVSDRFFNDILGPRPFLENLYYKGLSTGITKVGSQTINFLKVAQRLLDTR
jgi:hypothetical protein